MNQDELLEALEGEHEKLVDTIDDLPSEMLLEPTVLPGWSIKDILSHLNAWEAELVKLMWQVRQGNQVSTVHVSEISIDERNEQWQKLYKDRPLEVVLEDYEAVRKQTIRRTLEFNDRELNDPAAFPALRGIPLWKWIADDSFDHEREHLKQILKWKEGRPKR